MCQNTASLVERVMIAFHVWIKMLFFLLRCESGGEFRTFVRMYETFRVIDHVMMKLVVSSSGCKGVSYKKG